MRIKTRYDKDGNYIHHNELYKAIQELRERLVELGIPHGWRELYDGYQIWVPDTVEGNDFSGDAIQHYVSDGAERNLIEVWGFELEDPEGYLTVDEALEYFVRWWEAKSHENKA